jgi:hypothetical protein
MYVCMQQIHLDPILLDEFVQEVKLWYAYMMY